MKDRKGRKQMRQEDQSHYDSLERSKNEKARERFCRPAYYLMEKYGVKGGMRVGDRREYCEKRE